MLVMLPVLMFGQGCHATYARPLPPPIPLQTGAKAEQVLRTVGTAAGSVELVSGIVAMLGPGFEWVTSPIVDQIAAVIRDSSASAIEGIQANQAGTWDGDYVIPAGSVQYADERTALLFGALDDRKLAGVILITNASLDFVQGSLLVTSVVDEDPVGFGFGCGAMEHARAQITELVLEASNEADGLTSWPRQSFDPAACEAQLVTRSHELIDLAGRMFVFTADKTITPADGE